MALPEPVIVYYGTGLALGTVYLEDDTRIELRREPNSATWEARVPAREPKHALLEAYHGQAEYDPSEGELVVRSDHPQSCLRDAISLLNAIQ